MNHYTRFMLFNIVVVVRLLSCSFKFTSSLTFIFAVICSSMLATALIKYEKQIQHEGEHWQKVISSLYFFYFLFIYIYDYKLCFTSHKKIHRQTKSLDHQISIYRKVPGSKK